MMIRPFSKQRNNSSSNHFSNTDAFIVPGVYARRHKLDFTVCHNKPNSCLSLAADTNVDADSALTVRIAAIHLCLAAGLIDIYEVFFRNVFKFFQIGFYFFGGLFFVECALFFAKPEFS